MPSDERRNTLGYTFFGQGLMKYSSKSRTQWFKSNVCLLFFYFRLFFLKTEPYSYFSLCSRTPIHDFDSQLRLPWTSQNLTQYIFLSDKLDERNYTSCSNDDPTFIDIERMHRYWWCARRANLQSISFPVSNIVAVSDTSNTNIQSTECYRQP